ncbi:MULTISPECIES: AAA family ATPase [unclassified Microbacterium]|uniref:AAA family ATPase n=1 Tax=unclassified Microbacterium TaxID=2609290 RepID=UPI0004934405|nr:MULTISPECIES: AAA family ATPase [unclassified Microbacterium]
MTLTGSGSTRLVILRGGAASGKTTTARALRPALGQRVAVISQDHFRRELLHDPNRLRRSRAASILIVGAARQALDLGYDVILDGIFNLRDYAEAFESLYLDHRGTTGIYQFDVGLEETIRRHTGRPLANAFGEDEIRRWHDGWQPLPWFDERRVGPETTTDQLVTMILEDLGHRIVD